MTKIRLLIKADSNLRGRKDDIDFVFRKLKEDYEVVEGLTISWSIDFEQDYSNAKWVAYNPKRYPGSLGLEWPIIVGTAKKVRKLSGESIDSILHFVSITNWKAPGIGGWQVGIFSGYGNQIVKMYNGLDSLYMVVAMEVAHLLDNIVYLELGVSLDKYLGMDYDYDVIHGKHPDYNMYEYRPIFRKIGHFLIKTFEKRNKRFELQTVQQKVINILQRLIILYRNLIKQSKPKPIKDIEKVAKI